MPANQLINQFPVNGMSFKGIFEQVRPRTLDFRLKIFLGNIEFYRHLDLSQIFFVVNAYSGDNNHS